MTGSPNTTHTTHARRVIRLIHLDGVDTRAAIAEATGMSGSLVSRITADLLRRGILSSESAGRERPGRPTERLSLRPDAGHAVGVEIGREGLRIVRTDTHGDVTARWHYDHEADPFSSTSLQEVADRIQSASPRNGASPLLAVGLALPEVVTTDGVWRRTDGTGEPIAARDLLTNLLDVPVIVDDVSRAFADAEHRFGAGRDAPDMIYVFLGREGVGSGMFAGNAAIRSSTGICGEIGHVVVEPHGVRCSCGNEGCLETVATHAALLRSARSYLEQGVRSSLPPSFDVHDLLDAARSGDRIGTLVIHDLARHLHDALSPALALTGATTVVLGGDVRASGPTLPELLAQQLHRTVLPALGERIRVRWAALDRDAGARGVAVSALEASIRGGDLIRRLVEEAMAM